MCEAFTRRRFDVGVVVTAVALIGCTGTSDGDDPVNGTNGTDDEPVAGGTETTAETSGVGTTTGDSA